MISGVTKNFPTFGDNPFTYYTLVYQLMYHKLADKDKARRMYRDKNLYSSEFFKFSLNKYQNEYLDNILDVEKYSGLLFTNEQIELAKKFKLDDLVYDMSKIIFDTVIHYTNLLKDKEVKEFMLSYVSDFELFKKYSDYVYKFAIVMDGV
jgi:hypothetical protein